MRRTGGPVGTAAGGTAVGGTAAALASGVSLPLAHLPGGWRWSLGISLAARTSAEATRRSGMAQSLGYLLAAAGPVAVGWLRDRTGSWPPALLLVAAVAVAQAAAATVAYERK